jgi:hypothetical protein
MTKRNLILIHRGSDYDQDFKEIARKIVAIDKEIAIYVFPKVSTKQLPSLVWMYPTLIVSFADTFWLPIKRGKVLKNRQIQKNVQYERFRSAGIPTPPTLLFRFGMTLDPMIFGEFVVIKPLDVEQTSQGVGVQLFRRHRLEKLHLWDFPRDHPMHHAREGYLVQKFVDTGPYPSFYRVQTFFGRVIYSWHSILKTPRCPLDAPDEEIERTKIVSQGGEKDRKLVKDSQIVSLAEKVHAQFPDIPILAIDVLRDEATGDLYVLECNPGGNTWHFSSKVGEKIRLGFGNAKVNGVARANQIARRMFIEQFGAFDIVAKTLVEKTHCLAS